MPSRKFRTISAVIDQSSNQITAEIDLGESGVLQGIIMPSWTAANLTFQVAGETDSGSGVHVDSYDDLGVESLVVAAADRHLSLDPDQFAGARYIKIRSGTTGTPVTQAAARTLILLIENFNR